VIICLRTVCPWFDISSAYNPAIHRMKQALFHAATVQDLDSNPIPPPHPELTKYLETPAFVVDQSQKALDKLKKALDVKIGKVPQWE
jgi:ATP-dependent DNA helicase 2 subunit 2